MAAPDAPAQDADAGAAGDRSLSMAVPLAAVYLALIVYATLYPLQGWKLPGGHWQEWLHLPTPPWRIAFDVWGNFLGYVPLGALIALAIARQRGPLWLAAGVAALLPSMLSYGLEVTQVFIPGRYPSSLDWRYNTAGGLAGAALAVALQAGPGLQRWQSVRERWFVPDSGPVLALLCLWPFGLLFPAPLPLATGPSGERIREALLALFGDVPWFAEPVQRWAMLQPALRTDLQWLDVATMALGLLCPALLAASVMRPSWRRLGVALLWMGLGLAVTTLSTALNFGHERAFAWVEPTLWPALGLAALVALLAMPLRRRWALLLALAALLALVALVAERPADAYHHQSLRGWEQGQFISFHGLAQWIGWLWPLVAALVMAVRLALMLRLPRRPAARQAT